jgi:hypothetical protein
MVRPIMCSSPLASLRVAALGLGLGVSACRADTVAPQPATTLTTAALASAQSAMSLTTPTGVPRATLPPPCPVCKGPAKPLWMSKDYAIVVAQLLRSH